MTDQLTGHEESNNHRWPFVPLGDTLLRIEAGMCVSCEERPATLSEWGVLKVNAVSWGEFRPTANKVLPANFVVPDGAEVRAGDFLISRSNTTELVGAVVAVRETRPRLMLSDKTLRLVPRPESVSADFLEFVLRSRTCREFMERNATGTSSSMKNITQDTIRRIPIPLPPLAEQRRIAGRLREQLAEVAKARTAVQAQLAAAQALPAAALREVFDSEEGRQWEQVPLKNLIASPLRTGISKPTDLGSKIRCLTLSSVRNGILNTEKSKPAAITESELEKYRIRTGAFYVVRGNGNRSLVARAAQSPATFTPVAFPDLLIEVIPNESLLVPAYFRFAWDSPEVRRDIEDRVRTAAGIYKINLRNLSEVTIPLPSNAEQRAVAARLTAELAEATQLRKSLTEKLEAIDRLPAALLAQAFQGSE